MLTLESLSLIHPGRAPLHYPDRQLPAGGQAVVLGPSGSGKSSLLHLIGGLQRPTQGRVRVDGQAISEWPEARRDAFRGKRIGIVFQRLHLLGALSLGDNLVLAQRCAGLPVDRARVQSLLTQLGLGDLIHARPHALSGGQQQRAAIARALVNRPALVLADEPTASLDDDNAATVLDLLLGEAAREGAALLVATHDARARARFTEHWALAE
jgi:ABC-type lipoprotein export system ATPase subunit